MIKIITIFIFIATSEYFAQIFQTVDLEAGISFVSDLIISEDFSLIRKSNSDLSAIDSLFIKTKRFYKNDIEETLLALTFGTLPYYEMPLMLPVFNTSIRIPLPTKKKNFNSKIRNLPSHFLCDSPENDFGDKDKLAHFFGNAYLKFAIPFFNVSEFMSIFVEKFEESFKVEGALDYRDLVVNKLGQEFGEQLSGNSLILPSEILNNNKLEFYEK